MCMLLSIVHQRIPLYSEVEMLSLLKSLWWQKGHQRISVSNLQFEAVYAHIQPFDFSYTFPFATISSWPSSLPNIITITPSVKTRDPIGSRADCAATMWVGKCVA